MPALPVSPARAPRAPRPAPRSGRRRTVRPAVGEPGRGAALVEALVAAVVLAVGVLAVVGAVAGAARDVGRARAAAAAAELLGDRVAAWRAAPCAAGGGERTVGALRERWRVEVADGVAVLADTVTSAAGVGWPRAGVTAVAGCAP